MNKNGYEKEFMDLYKEFENNEIGNKFLELEGISSDKINPVIMSERYFNKRLADISVDQNANANESISPNNYQSEVTKGSLKLVGYHLLWQRAKNKLGLERANELMKKIWTKDYYFHDASAHGIQTIYCLAFSTYSIMLEGRPYGQLKSLAPKRADSFIGQVIEAIMDISNVVMGAVSPADILVNYAHLSEIDRNELADMIEEWWFAGNGDDLFPKLLSHEYHIELDKVKGLLKYRHESDCYEVANRLMRHKIENDIQKMVHIVNNKYRTSGQSPFTNVSIFCPRTLEKLFGETVFPNGEGINYEYTMYVQQIFGEFMAKGDPATGLPYRFPVATINMSKDEDGNVDDKFLDWVAENNYKKGVFNIYTSEGSKIAMCPLHGKEEVVVKNKFGIIKTPIQDLQPGWHMVLCDGEFVKGEFNEYKTDKWRRIYLENGDSYITTPEHLNVTQRGNIPTKELEKGDKIRITNKAFGEEGTYKDYNIGYFIGVMLGNNYFDNGKVVIVSNTAKTRKEIKTFCDNYDIMHKETLNATSIKFISQEVQAVAEKYTRGGYDSALGLTAEVYRESIKFRKGIIDGYENCYIDKVIQTSSKRMMSDLKFLVSSVGYSFSIDHFGEKPTYQFMVNKNPDEFVGIKTVRAHKSAAKKAYCFSMESNDHLFQLANGVITHNCRYQNDLQQMRNIKVDTFGNGGMNIGSARVITLNLPRIAIRAKGNEEKFMEILEEEANGIRDLMVIHRELLKERVDQGFIQFIKPLSWVSLDRMFATIGEHGIYEANWFMGYDIFREDGQAFTERVLAKLEELTSRYTDETGIVFNIEEIPGESAAVSLAKADKLMFDEDTQPFEMYSNQFVPNIADANVFEKMKLSGKFLEAMSGGGIAHINVDEVIRSPKAMKKLILLAIKYGVPHFAINYGFGICENGHVSVVGNGTRCPICGGKIDDWLTRIIGYFVKVSSWNKVRKDWEFPKRNFEQLK